MAKRFCRNCNGLIDKPMNGKFYCCPKCEEEYNTRLNDSEDLINWTILKNYRMWANDRGISFDITLDDMKEVYLEQEKKCAITGLPLYFRPNKVASLDRINSAGNYTRDNIQWVHKDINKMRNSFSVEYFIKMCKAVVEHQNVITT